ncbi:MAG TPA: ACT domain-containing protein, partial [Acidimicrobiales bacterium]|nr:ACT domain-containing protein [Acidimicrobiales bacterium]
RSGAALSVVRVRYPDGRGLLREILKVATDRGFSVNELSTENTGDRVIEVTMHVRGRGSIHDLASALSELERVEAVAADDANASSE